MAGRSLGRCGLRLVGGAQVGTPCLFGAWGEVLGSLVNLLPTRCCVSACGVCVYAFR